MKAETLQRSHAFPWLHKYHNPMTMEEVKDRIYGAIRGGFGALIGYYGAPHFIPFLQISELPKEVDLNMMSVFWTAFKGILWIVVGAYGGQWAGAIAKDHYAWLKPRVKTFAVKKYNILKAKLWKKKKL